MTYVQGNYKMIQYTWIACVELSIITYLNIIYHLFFVTVLIAFSELVPIVTLRKSTNPSTPGVAYVRPSFIIYLIIFYPFFCFVSIFIAFGETFQCIVSQISKLLPMQQIFFDLVIRFITNRKYAFFCIYQVSLLLTI